MIVRFVRTRMCIYFFISYYLCHLRGKEKLVTNNEQKVNKQIVSKRDIIVLEQPPCIAAGNSPITNNYTLK